MKNPESPGEVQKQCLHGENDDLAWSTGASSIVDFRLQDKELHFEMILSPNEAAEGGLFPITVPVIEPCPKCGKTGYWEAFICPVCFGCGRIRTERAFSLSVPPNIRHGAQIRISMEDIGLKGTHLNIQVLIDPYLEEEVL